MPNDDPIATPNFTDNLNPNSLLIPHLYDDPRKGSATTRNSLKWISNASGPNNMTAAVPPLIRHRVRYRPRDRVFYLPNKTRTSNLGRQNDKRIIMITYVCYMSETQRVAGLNNKANLGELNYSNHKYLHISSGNQKSDKSSKSICRYILGGFC